MNITDEYRRGFEDARQGALICCRQYSGYDLRYPRSCQRNRAGAIQSIERMAPELHAGYVRRGEELHE